MMIQVNLNEFDSQLATLVTRVEPGEEVVLARDGLPVARLVPMPSVGGARRAGLLRGQIWIAQDFDDPLPPDLQALFEGDD